MPQLEAAVKAWSEQLGAEHVRTDQSTLDALQTTTFRSSIRVTALLRPADRGDVQEAVRIANRYKVPIYPLSRGKNYGLGSRVPTRDLCVVMSLDRLDRIVDFDEQLAYITVEPGVTFSQLADLLAGRKSSLFTAMIGGPPDSSLIGNVLERGDGLGPCGERVAHACAMEVVLPNGECIETGFARFPDSKVAPLHRWGIGPSLDGLFAQSAFGIVTRMTFWLRAKPPAFETFLFTIRDMDRLRPVLHGLRRLQSLGVLAPNSTAIWNSIKLLASEHQYPWDHTGGRTPLTVEEVKRLKLPWSDCEWVGVGALYGASRRHAREDRRLLKKTLRRHVDRFVCLDSRRARWALLLKRPLTRLAGVDVESIITALYQESVFLGHPTERSLRSTYWRKRIAIPPRMDPDRDRCGVLWLCPAVPFAPDPIQEALGIITRTSVKHGFEPQIAFVFPSERVTCMFPALVYDRQIDGQDEQAMACHDEMFDALVSAGYYPFRLGIQSMDLLRCPNDEYGRLLGRLKELFDPVGILAPGRYHLRAGAATACLEPHDGSVEKDSPGSGHFQS